jgi:hypothetical protein
MLSDIYDKEQGISTCICNVVEILYSSCRCCEHFVLICIYCFFIDIFLFFYEKKSFFTNILTFFG